MTQPNKPLVSQRIEGRIAKRPWVDGDLLPAVGSLCLVSGANQDIESDQHRAYAWRTVVGYGQNDQFVCLQTEGCWPTVERLASCWFAEIPAPRPAETLASLSSEGEGRPCAHTYRVSDDAKAKMAARDERCRQAGIQHKDIVFK